MTSAQGDLFGPDLPAGLRYAESFLDRSAEAALVEMIREQPLANAEYRQYRARRRVVSYGGKYDFTHGRLDDAPPLPAWLTPLRLRAATWAGLDPNAISQALIAEYAPGTPLGWHRDVPDFESVVGVSLGGFATMRFRRYPPIRQGDRAARADLKLVLAARSIYTLQDEARWGWQHAVSPTRVLRYSITFRTARHPPT